ncbi:EAL domain-containing protein [Paenibacillus methanolicus]|uniref:EAL domain-containing protein (Putative c-di-GMP-specific phosphodiesterase class I) n=1 Tax=Paenibacillus methanolicus TaxID=582686 RepID=A0A5S5C846_9BACL|nr:EAL domain-containing protein [Paenibacillus methanolicus]TYP75514.1 EAL domain-containing protein (putative c-di-GMP-specific phosphodiesterase class I) [Paenibacillus methanolicus]
MSECRSCQPGELLYRVTAGTDANEEVLQGILPFMRASGVVVKEEEGAVTVRESGMADFMDFCRDHMNTSGITFRLDGEEERRPFEALAPLLDARWIDSIVFQGRVVPYCQPILDRDGKLFAHEILSRFAREDGTLAPPGEVFRAAKARGRLYALDRVCRMSAVKCAAELPGKVFINFIPTSIYAPEHCLRSTVALAGELGIDPSRFVFEVVETEYVEDLAHLKGILDYYRRRGFQYALDDVGEGFSTVEMLRELKPHYMKLDMGYVRGVAGDPRKQEVALKLLAAAREIGAVPLGEGVEAREDYDWLRQAGFELFQGYLFGKPAPVHGKQA